MKLAEIILELENWAPPTFQESYDNSGLIVGDKNQEITKAVICLDSTEAVVDEAISLGANLIIAHHPIVFKGLKKFNGKNYVERAVMKAIKNEICIYAIHTNLDNVKTGVNKKVADLLNLDNQSILSPKSKTLSKLVFYCPKESSEAVKKAIYSAGGGQIGNYEECSYSSEGIGTFQPTKGANPHTGNIGNTEVVDELRIEILVKNHLIGGVLSAMKKAHPYEEVAHEVYSIENLNNEVGSGMIGELNEDHSIDEFLQKVKSTFKAGVVKYTEWNKNVSKVAVCGGSGGFLLNAAKASGADVFLTSDYKYHEFFDAEDSICIMDIGHYESEQFTLELIQSQLKDKLPNFAARLTEVNTNPVKYF